MRRKKGLLPVLFLAAIASAWSIAQENVVRKQVEPLNQGILFATPLLSEAEQADYRARIRMATDASEKERIRAAHYELMKARARERGYALPEIRPAAAGETGNSFGPQLITEEERASQRAKSRGVRNQASAETVRQIRRDAIVGATPPGRQEQAAPDSKLEEGAKANLGVAVTASPAPSASVRDPAPSLIVLPGIDGIFGPQLMSEEEKAAYRKRLRGAKSDGERQAIRDERDGQMRLRAREKGKTLPP